MMGERAVRQEPLFYGFNLDDHVPAGHLLLSIDHFVELTIWMLLIGHCCGIRSERRLRGEVHLSLAYRWFCRLGLSRMADVTRGVSYHRLVNVAQWPIAEDNYAAARAVVVDARHRHPMGAIRSDGTVSSSDGQCFRADGRAGPGGDVNARYGIDPGLQLIVNHCGSPIDRDEEGMRRWRDGLRLISAHPNVALKISNMAAYDKQQTQASLRDVALHCIDCFGPDRSMLATDYPVARLQMTFDAIYDSFKQVVADFSEHEQHALFHDNADRFYRLDDLAPVRRGARTEQPSQVRM